MSTWRRRLRVVADHSDVLSAADDQQVAGDLVERVGAVGRADDDVLDARAVAAIDVDAGLDAESVAGLERLVVARNHVRILVALEADAVPGAMDELLAQAGVVDDSPRGPIDVLALTPGLTASVLAAWRAGGRRRAS